MSIRRSIFALAAFSAACKGATPASDIPADSLHPAGSAAAIEVVSPDQSFKLMLPQRLAGHFRTDTLSSAERGTALPGALNVVYLPQDTSVIPQTLLVVAVYDSAAWTKLKAAGGPPPGDSLRSDKGRVYVISLPQSNPFAPGSADALRFDSLAIKPTDQATLIKIP